MKKNAKYYKFTLMALFAAITLIMGFTPLGYIPLPFIKMTVIHIPVILGSVLLGPQYGAGLGALFGLTSLINNTMMPAVTSFTFSPFIPLPGTTGYTSGTAHLLPAADSGRYFPVLCVPRDAEAAQRP